MSSTAARRPSTSIPICEKILSETNGVMVYQEQVMRILNELGGIELAAAYTCIKAISKKKEETIAKNREQFVKGAQANGLKQQQALDFWNLIIKFAGYGFNKSHSTAYALIAYMTAYLKAHYPVEFMAAPAVGRYSRPQFQDQGFARRAPGRLPANGHRGRAAGCEPLGRRFHGRRRQDSVRPVRDQGLRRQRGRSDRRGPQSRRPVPRPVRFLRASR